MTTAFWERKMKTYFQRIDFDKDGSITKADFEGMGNRFVECEKVDAATGVIIKSKLNAVFEKYVSAVGGGSDQPINQAAFIEGMRKLVADVTDRAILTGPLPLFFEAVDANSDGYISADEYAGFFAGLGLDGKMGPESFAAIDTDKDGQLSKKEFVDAGLAFFTDDKDENCPTRYFWGPLVE